MKSTIFLNQLVTTNRRIATALVWSTSRLSTRAITFHALHVTLGKYNQETRDYADDTQLYISSRPGETHQIEKLMECIVDIKKWMMSQSFLTAKF